MMMMIPAATLAGIVMTTTVATGGHVDFDLQAKLVTMDPDDSISVLVYLEQANLGTLLSDLAAERASLSQRHENVVRLLQATAEATQPAVIGHLQAWMIAGGVESCEPYWVANCIRVETRVDQVEQLAAIRGVDTIYFNYPIELVDPVALSDDDSGDIGIAGAVENGVLAVRADECWDIGIDGTGVLVANIDTGVDGGHPAISSRWAGTLPAYAGHPEWAWFDPYSGDNSFPFDYNGHGTHTIGTVCGGSPGDSVGVAPGAHWMAAGAIDRGGGVGETVADAIESFQWMIDPDGDPATNFDVPAVVSNSWGLADAHGYPDCDELFWTYLDAQHAAGTVVLFSAGNEGSGGLRRPSDRATNEWTTHAVAAVDGNTSGWPIASFSSRGPTYCTPDGSAAIKPDISAPGVNVRSSVPGGGYSSYSGTSMASPHVNGVVALMRQANPAILPEDIHQIIFETAVDLGGAGEDNDYGWGMIDAFECVQRALETATLSWEFPEGLPDRVDPSGGTTLVARINSYEADPVEGTATLWYATDGATYTAIGLEPDDAGVCEVELPSFECGAEVSFWFSVEATTGDVVTSPYGAPDQAYTADAISGVETGFEDDFETDLGWTVENSDTLTFGEWERGVPAGTGDRGDPPNDADGSGQCYLTDNEYGNFDIDDGWTELTSPNMDASHPDAILAYDRWYHNTFGADPANDLFVVTVSDDGGATWVGLETVGPDGGEVSGGWIHKEFLVSDIPGISNSSTLRVRFNASDLNEGSVVEAGVDGVAIQWEFCQTPGDVTGDGVVNTADILAILAAWGPCPACPEDLNADGVVGVPDLLIVLDHWG